MFSLYLTAKLPAVNYRILCARHKPTNIILSKARCRSKLNPALAGRPPPGAPDRTAPSWSGSSTTCRIRRCEATETQFTRLLEAAAGPSRCECAFTSCRKCRAAPAAARALRGARLLATSMSCIRPAGCPDRHRHGTAAAERCPMSRTGRRFVEVLEWADANTVSSIWSCLAAHAAVLHFDGVQRQRLRAEAAVAYFGTTLSAGHPLMAGVAAPLSLPHSRWNDLPVAALREAGYTILSSSTDTGADTFTPPAAQPVPVLPGPSRVRGRDTAERVSPRRRPLPARRSSQHYPLLPQRLLLARRVGAAEGVPRTRTQRAARPQLLAEFPTAAAAAGLAQYLGRRRGAHLSQLAGTCCGGGTPRRQCASTP